MGIHIAVWDQTTYNMSFLVFWLCLVDWAHTIMLSNVYEQLDTEGL